MGMGLAFKVAGSGPPLVLLHPVGLSSDFWPEIADRLHHSHRVYCVDLAGHGTSPDAARPGRMADRIGDVADLLDREVGAAAAVLGVSFGGMIAMNLALERPNSIRALILAACPAAIPREARDAIRDRGRAAESGGMQAVLDATLERWFSEGEIGSEIASRVRARLGANSPSNWAAAWEAVSDHDALALLSDINVPTLVVAGEQDQATPLAAMETISQEIAGSRLVVLTGAPHMLHLERAGDFADVVEAFLAGVVV